VATLPDELVETLHEAIGFDAICSGTLDPSTLLPTTVGGVGLGGAGGKKPDPLAGVTSDPLTAALTAPERARTRALASAPHSFEIFGQGDTERPFYRHVLVPQGREHCLRAMLVSDGACWGFMGLLRDTGRADFTVADAEVAEALAHELARAVRRSVLAHRGIEADHPHQPGVIVLDDALTVVSVSAEAQHWISELGDAPELVPAVIRGVAIPALLDDAPGVAQRPRARARTRSGVWLHVHATALHGAGPRTVAIVIEPVRADHVSPVIAHAYGLTARERQVAALVVEGASTAEIADQLVIVPYTVGDHLKAIFDKVGVRNRRELAHALATRFTQRPDAPGARPP